MNKEQRIQEQNWECSGSAAYVFITPTIFHVPDALLCSVWNHIINYLMSVCATQISRLQNVLFLQVPTHISLFGQRYSNCVPSNLGVLRENSGIPHAQFLSNKPREYTYVKRTNKMDTFYVNSLIIVSSTCFEQPSVHPQEELYMQLYGFYFMHPYKQSGRCQVFLRMNTWMFKTCRRHYN